MTMKKTDVMFDLNTMARVIQALTAAKEEIDELTAINQKLSQQLTAKASTDRASTYVGQWTVSPPCVTYAKIVVPFELKPQVKPIPAANAEGTSTVQ